MAWIGGKHTGQYPLLAYNFELGLPTTLDFKCPCEICFYSSATHVSSKISYPKKIP
jgi:hypothetical protein